ncbi:hypothetical protein EC991_001075 [Linnemannia zychae]|nr:hypothetical protein EC991_001075 [Linnemannia zychae]
MQALMDSYSRTSAPPSAVTKHKDKRLLSPLNIPEILDLIFSYIDSNSIRWSVAFVCRRWYQLNHGRLPRSVVVHSFWSLSRLDTIPSRLAGAAQLYFCISTLSTGEYYRVPREYTLMLLLSRIQDEYQRQLEQRQQQQRSFSRADERAPLYKFMPLQQLHLDIRGEFGIPLLNHYLVFASTLVKLTITHLTTKNDRTAIAQGDLSKILLSCPLLEFFEARGSYRLVLIWTPFVLGEQAPFGLRSLILNSTNFKPEYLENLLAFTPRLNVLKLIGMDWSFYQEYHWCGFIGRLRSLSIALDTVFISDQFRTMPSQVQQQQLEISPVLSEWNLWPQYVSPSLLQELEHHTTNYLTSLELFVGSTHQSRANCSLGLTTAPTALHYVLTTSDKLVHLRTLKTVVMVEHMDIYRRAEFGQLAPSRQPSSPAAGSLWRCRRLHTLHLEIHGHSSTVVGSMALHGCIVFGYISRVFPVLEELKVWSGPECYFQTVNGPTLYYSAIYFELEGGLCLLGRLKHLQRLEVIPRMHAEVTSNISEEDLNWMVPSGQSDKFRKLRRKKFERLYRQHLEQFKQMQEQEQEQSSSPKGDCDHPDAELLYQLRNLGRIEDIKDMILKMDDKSYRALPSLEGLAFEHFLLEHPERVIRQLFPRKTGKQFFGIKLGKR